MKNIHRIIFIPFIILGYCSFVTNSSGTIIANGVSKAEAKYILNVHNKIRHLIKFGVYNQPAAKFMKHLKWSDSIARKAQWLVNKCENNHFVFYDENNNKLGQNIYQVKFNKFREKRSKWKEPIKAWFNERTEYKFPNPPTKRTGHYTQLVWANTTHLGCGYAYCKENNKSFKKIYICNYEPGGNYPRSPYLRDDKML